MNWNSHSNLLGRHALFSPSGYHWLNYDAGEESIDLVFKKYKAQYATLIGTTLHEYAEKRIRYKLRMYKTEKNNVLMYLLDKGIPMSVIDLDSMFDNLLHYVNDAIGFQMDPEVVLYYSENCFGTTDAIYFRNKELRIHDYKSGAIPAHMEQPLIYSALFCLEYSIKPMDISTHLRIYQMNEIMESDPEPEEIQKTMDQIVRLDKIVTKWKAEDKMP